MIIRSVLYSILEKACDNDILVKNPLSAVGSPKLLIDDEDKINPFNESELKIIMKQAQGYMKNFIQFMVSTGVRPGEIIALKWSDISFEKRLLNFRT